MVLVVIILWSIFAVFVVDSCSTSSGGAVSQQTPLKLLTPSYNQTSAKTSPYGSCGHNTYWNVGEGPRGTGIIGGRTVLTGEFPWQVAITVGNSFCGGTVLNANYVLTAGHCARAASVSTPMRLGFGGYNRNLITTYRTASAVTIHPDYTLYQNVSINDLAVVKLNSPLSFTNWNIQPICLPNTCDDTCQPGEYAVVSGWGLSENGSQPEVLRTTTLQVITPFECANYYLDSYIFENAVCAGTESSAVCSGDSGGPLACYKNGYFTLMGVVANGGTCNHAMKGPSIFTRVCSYISWIKSIIN